MNKYFLVLLGVCFFCPIAYAYQDVLINVNDRSFGLCLSANGIDNPVCANNTLFLDGREDATVYILPETEINSNTSTGDKFRYALLTPVNLMVGTVGMFMFVIGLSASLMYLFVRLNKNLIRK